MSVRKTALVTGGARRIGAALAEELAAAGNNVVVHYRTSRREAEALASRLAGYGVECLALPADLASEEETEELFQRAENFGGGIDILVNSASIFPDGRLAEFTWEQLEENLRVNSWAPLRLCRRFARQERFARRSRSGMIPAQELGNIVNLLDTRIVDRDPAHVPYHLSKRMLFSLTRMLSLELAPTVRVNGIAPGLILPPPGEDSGYLERMRKTNPLERYGGTHDIAAAMRFLLESAFVTGEVLFVDGGPRTAGSMYGT